MQEDDDFRFEPIRGLPAALPEGEDIAWQGTPALWPLAWRAGFLRLLTIWFVLIAAWYVARGALGITPWSVTLPTLAIWTVNTVVAGAILSVIALGIQRTTVYTITNRRLVMRFGMVLDLTVNIPFSKIENMDLRPGAGGTGDLSVRMKDSALSYFHLWPHARPWCFSKPEAMLRAVPSAPEIGQLLARLVTAEQARLQDDGTAAVAGAVAPDRAPASARPSTTEPLPTGTLHPAE
ncbi:MAG: photosynthetic complex putative assembly protein PuhB [Pseudomonadota bacterium]